MHLNRQVFDARIHDLVLSTIAEFDGVGGVPASKAEPKARSHCFEFGARELFRQRPALERILHTVVALVGLALFFIDDEVADSFELQIAAIPLIADQAFREVIAGRMLCC